MKIEIEKYIKTWEQRCYFNGIPDEVPLRIDQLNKAPSYKRIALSILKNDLELIGITPKKSIYYSMLKRIEIDNRDCNQKKQLTLF
jgi:predicted phosphoadenosine phosphosulfate sulfurtransferase